MTVNRRAFLKTTGRAGAAMAASLAGVRTASAQAVAAQVTRTIQTPVLDIG